MIYSDPNGVGYLAQYRLRKVKFDSYAEADEYIELRTDGIGHNEAMQQVLGFSE